jgi:peptidoglycan/xylan/chitin deacetylase (PgdA/CDA1 family)
MANYMSASELVSLQSRGHDIGSHSKSHWYLKDLSEDVIREQCSLSKVALESYGLTINNFAFPYGGTNEQANLIALEYYHSVRSAYAEPFLMPVGSSGVLTGYQGESNPWLNSKLDEVAASNSWTIIFFHNVVHSYSDLPEEDRPYSITTAEFATFIDYALSKGIQILPVEQALDLTASP